MAAGSGQAAAAVHSTSLYARLRPAKEHVFQGPTFLSRVGLDSHGIVECTVCTGEQTMRWSAVHGVEIANSLINYELNSNNHKCWPRGLEDDRSYPGEVETISCERLC